MDVGGRSDGGESSIVERRVVSVGDTDFKEVDMRVFLEENDSMEGVFSHRVGLDDGKRGRARPFDGE